MLQYKQELAPRCLTIRYEDLVDDLEGGMHQVLDFVGVDFEPACVAFHENRRYARTASQLQVAEPLYTRSRYRWRNYRRNLEPVMAALRPIIEKLGYEI